MSNRSRDHRKQSFGKALKCLRLSHNMSQKHLASQVSVTPQAVSKWENDLSQPDIQTIRKITDIFEISYDELFSMSLANEKRLIVVGEKASEIGRYYDLFTLYLSGLFIAFILIAIYTSRVSDLTWHFPLGFGLLAGIDGLFLCLMVRARFNFLETPKVVFELYEDRIVLLTTGDVIPLRTQPSVKVTPYKSHQDIGKIRIRDKNQHYLLRDIRNIAAIRATVSQSLYKNQPTELEQTI